VANDSRLARPLATTKLLLSRRVWRTDVGKDSRAARAVELKREEYDRIWVVVQATDKACAACGAS
jgi:hypothetical protein